MSRKPKTNPIVDFALGALEKTGQKMMRDFLTGGLPGVVDGALEDIEQLNVELGKRVKTARGRIASRRKR